MADMAPAEAVREISGEILIQYLVAYVNTTRKSRLRLISAVHHQTLKRLSVPYRKTKDNVLPDQNLGANIMKLTGRKMDLWPGYCPTHNRMMPDAAEKIRAEYPDAAMVVHPECSPAIVEIADSALSTAGILDFAKKTDAKQIIIGTETGILHRLRKENPGKEFIPLIPLPVCPNMKKITLEKVLDSLKKMQFPVELDAALVKRARVPVERMFEF